MKLCNCLFRQANRGIGKCSHLKSFDKFSTQPKVIQVYYFFKLEVLDISRRKPSRSPSVMGLRISEQVCGSIW
jgi:hypothetical protein